MSHSGKTRVARSRARVPGARVAADRLLRVPAGHCWRLSLIGRKGLHSLVHLSAVLALLCSWSPWCVAMQEFTVQPSVDSSELEWGEYWLAELGCVQCHLVDAGTRTRLQPKVAPKLAGIGARMSRASLRAYLLDPQAARPGTEMPATILGEQALQPGGVLDELVAYLASSGAEGVEHDTFDPEALELGRQLYHEVGCIACHAPHEDAPDLTQAFWELQAPAELPDALGVAAHPLADSLDGLDQRWTLTALSTFLRDPLQRLPSGRMPSFGLDAHEAFALASYLLGRSRMYDDAAWVEEAGLAYDYYEGDFAGSLPSFDDEAIVRSGVALDLDELPEHREEGFAFRFRGLLEVPASGEYQFLLESDDGSDLWIDGRKVIDNDGDHAPTEVRGKIQLSAGRHPLQLGFYENAGGESLRLRWQGPGFERRRLLSSELSHLQAKLQPLAERATTLVQSPSQAGRSHFLALGCARCHEPESAPQFEKPIPRLEALLAARADQGCMSAEPPPHVPHYSLNPRQRSQLQSLLQRLDFLAGPLDAHAQMMASTRRFGCAHCHRRSGDMAGPARGLWPYFRTRGGAELGDEGRIPPELDGVGAKLRPEWLRAVLEDDARARPYMAARMPSYGAANLSGFVDHLLTLDRDPSGPAEPSFSLEEVANGRKLVGTAGLGCIQCHTFAGHASLGVPAVDLADSSRRLQYGWFRELLRDPARVNQGTRMPLFWLEGKSPVGDVCNGDPERQIEALWTYLSLGQSAPLPAGLVLDTSAYELVPDGRVRLIGVFMAGLSPRTLAVGSPENIHYAFDVQNSRLAKIWRGRFFQAEGTWVGRAGALESPPTQDVLEQPAGAPFALLADAQSSWPVFADAAQAGYRVLGRRQDAMGRPTFRYALGDIEIEETPSALLQQGGSALRRHFRLSAKRAHTDLWFRAAEARTMPSQLGALWLCDERRVRLVASSQVELRQGPEAWELLVHVDDWHLDPQEERLEAEFAVELSW